MKAQVQQGGTSIEGRRQDTGVVMGLYDNESAVFFGEFLRGFSVTGCMVHVE